MKASGQRTPGTSIAPSYNFLTPQCSAIQFMAVRIRLSVDESIRATTWPLALEASALRFSLVTFA